jgi:hypothetical protein
MGGAPASGPDGGGGESGARDGSATGGGTTGGGGAGGDEPVDAAEPEDQAPADDAMPDAAGEAADASTGPVSAGPGKTTCLNADGPGGRDPYQLIYSLFGAGSIEAPDNQHMPPFRHLTQDTDPVVGPHFVVLIHRDIDLDPTSATRADRQRMEIKIHTGAADELKGHDGSTFTYTWRFKLAANLKISSSFSIFFQIKSEGGNSSLPIAVLTGAGSTLEIHQVDNGNASHTLASTPFAPLTGQWLEASVHVTYGHKGAFAMTVKKADGTMVLNANAPGADMWRDGTFTRPKWGIYRSLNDKAALNPGEDSARFANIGITSGAGVPTSDCRNGR